MKFGRQYKMFVENLSAQNEPTLIELPFTVKFDIQRTAESAANNATFYIYNLKESTRVLLQHDRYNPRVRKRIMFMAGYSNLAAIFTGDVFEGYSFRDGPDIVTYITARDGGFDMSNSISNFTAPAGMSTKDIIQKLIQDFSSIREGFITETLSGRQKRGVVCVGNTYQLIKRETNEKVFVDMEVLNVLNPNENITYEVPLIDSNSGLLGTPKREDSYISVDMLLDTNLAMAQIVDIRSSVQKLYNGQYKIIGISHRGTISEAECGEATTTLNLLIEDQFLGRFSRNLPNATSTKPNSASNSIEAENANSSITLKGRIETTSVKPGQSISVVESNRKFTYPLTIKGTVTGVFNEKRSTGRHRGYDIAAPRGTKVLAANSGVVTFAGFGSNANHYNNYGNLVVLKHDNGMTTMYAHLSKILVTKGQTIDIGKTVGLVGSTGRSSGNHLHFEMIDKGKQVDPAQFVRYGG